jgi:hypothetical protein
LKSIQRILFDFFDLYYYIITIAFRNIFLLQNVIYTNMLFIIQNVIIIEIGEKL